MSAGETPSSNAGETEDAPEPRRRFSVQDLQAALAHHVYTLAKEGIFTGRQPAQAVLLYYVFNTAANDSKPRGFRRGFVMPGCTYPASVANATSWSDEAVRKANSWLHEQRFIEISNVQPDGERSIEILCYDAESEDTRLKLLTEDGPATAPRLKRGPRSKRTRRATAEAPNSTHSGDATNVSGNTPPPNSTDVDTYSSDSSIYIPDDDMAERAQARASIGVDQIDRREEGKRASAAPPPGVAGQPADSRPVGEIFNDLVSLAAKAYASDTGSSYGKARKYVASTVDSIRGDSRKLGYLESVLLETSTDDDDGLVDILREYLSFSSAAPRQPRAKRAAPGRAAPKPQYDNRFRFGMSKDGTPYFSKGGKPLRTDEGTVTMTPEEAVEFFRLQKADNGAWINFKRELYAKYRVA